MKTDNPYVGPRSFEEEDSRNFFGRKEETRQLASLVIAHRAVLLYASSGAGKTSLLSAGLIPYLKQRKRINILPIARVGGDLPPDVDGTQVKNIYAFNTLLDLAGEETQPDVLVDRSLSEGLAAYFVPPSGQRRSQPCLLILDQFEELFTTHPERYPERADFFFQLQNSLKDHPQLSLLLSMREDYIAQLSSYAAQLPDRLRTRFRLELLGEEAAHQAVQEPARHMEVDFADIAAEKLVNDLRKVQVQQPDGTITEQLGRHIEPVQLQVVCRRLWGKLPEDAAQIGETDVEAVGNVDTALSDYYADRVKTSAENTGVRERAIREWFERQLLTEQGIRGQVLKGPEQSQGLENQAIAPLVDAHLVRVEKRLNAIWYELAHDRLIEPVRNNNAKWFRAHLNPLQRQADLWESRGRPGGLLLRGKPLKEAEAWAADHQDELTPAENDFLAACREARTQAQKERQKNRLIRGLAIAATIIMFIAIYFFVQARNEAVRARQAEKMAKFQAEEALKAKEEAEGRFFASLARDLIYEALRQQDQGKQDERAILLVRQAYLFSQRTQYHMPDQITEALRIVLNTPYFSHTLRGHKYHVLSVAFSPDGKTLAAGCSDNTVRLWELQNLSAVPTVLRGHERFVSSVTFSLDSKTLASSSWDGTVRLWDLQDLSAEPTVLRGHKSGISSVAFSPDGKTLASGSDDKTVRLWDLQDLSAEPTLLQGHEKGLRSVAFSLDGKTLASGGYDKTIRLWDLQNLDTVPIVLSGHEHDISSVAFSPDGKTLASGSYDKTVRLWDLQSPYIAPIVLSGHEGRVYAVRFSPDGRTLVSVGDTDNIVRLWDLTTPDATPEILHGHENTVRAVAFSPDGKTLASGSYDRTVRLWDLQNRETAPIVLRSHEDAVSSVAFSPDGKTLLSGSKDRTVRLWDLQNRETVPIVLRSHEDAVSSVAFSPDGKTLASGSYDRIVRLWDLQNPIVKPTTVLHGHERSIYSVVFSPDGKILASGSSDNTLRLWSLQAPNAEPIVLQGHEGWIISVAFSPDGKTLASGSTDNTVRLWDLQNLDTVPDVLYGHENSVYSVAFSPDGKTLASGSRDRTVRLWDLQNPSVEPTILRGHKSSVYSVTFSPDGKTLASGSEDSTVRLWDLQNPETASIVLRSHEGPVSSVAFSPDGEILVSGSTDKTIRIWVVCMRTLFNKVCKRVWYNLSVDEWRHFVGPDISYERTCLNLPIHPSFVEMGQDLAKKGAIDGAIAIFRQALKIDPGLELDPEKEANKWVVEGLIEKGKRSAKDGDVDGAVMFLQKALKLDSSLDLDPKAEANRWAASALVEKGEKLAKDGDVDGAVTSLQKALKLDSSLDLAPKAEANKWSASTLLEKGEERAKDGDVDGAIALFQKAQELDPSLELDPKIETSKLAALALVENGKQLAKQGKIQEAITAYTEAKALDPTLNISVHSWNVLCRYGSLWGYAAEVMNACEQVVMLTSEQEQSYRRDSRGLARALTGNIEGAIDDFQAYILWVEKWKENSRDQKRLDMLHQKRLDMLQKKLSQQQRWIDALQAGENPFTPEVLEKMR